MPTSPRYRLWMGAVENICWFSAYREWVFQGDSTKRHPIIRSWPRLLTGAGKTGDQSPNIPV